MLLARSDIDPERKNPKGLTPLAWAASLGLESSVKQFSMSDKTGFCQKTTSRSSIPLLLAAEYGHYEVVWLLLNYDADIEATNDYGKTPLWLAAENGHPAVVQLLIERGAIIDIENWILDTPVLIAAEKGHCEVVQILLAGGAAPGAKTCYGWTSLLKAARNGHGNVVQLLVNQGGDAEGGNSALATLLLDTCTSSGAGTGEDWGNTLLQWATEKGFEDVVGLLLSSSDADINSREESNLTPLSLAAENGHEAIVKQLLDSGAELLLDAGAVEFKTSYLGKTPLSRAIEEVHAAIARMLLEKRANSETDVAMNTDSGMGLMLRAARNGHESVVRLLIETGSSLECKEKYPNSLYEAAQYGHEAIVRLLIDSGANPGSSDINKHDRLPLRAAAELGHESIAQVLIQRGADPNPKIDSFYFGPLQLAAKEGHEGIVKLLRESGADIEAMKDGETALFLATKHGHGGVVRLLLHYGANTEVKANYRKDTPLINAARKSCHVILQLLLEAGANVDSVDASGRTALWYAVDRKAEKIVELLLNKGANIDSEDGYGKTPFQSALESQLWTIVRLMKARPGVVPLKR